MTTAQYEPRQVRSWSTRELDTLIGRDVSVNVNGSEHEGVCTAASVGRHGIRFVDFQAGGSVEWQPDDDVYITVRTA